MRHSRKIISVNAVSHFACGRIKTKLIAEMRGPNGCLPNQDASSLVRASGSVGSVSVWNVTAGKPRPIPDDKFERLASTLIKICK